MYLANKKLTNHKQIGDLVWESDGSLKWIVKKQGDITKYPLGKDGNYQEIGCYYRTVESRNY